MPIETTISRSKYTPEKMLAALRHFVVARNDALSRELISDNGGAIHSVERVLDILSMSVCYPHLSHRNNLKRSPEAVCSTAAHLARLDGQKVEIEHVLPMRAYAKRVCDLVNEGQSDAELLNYIRDNFRLVLLTKEERAALDRFNRSKLSRDRLAEAGISMHRYE